MLRNEACRRGVLIGLCTNRKVRREPENCPRLKQETFAAREAVRAATLEYLAIFYIPVCIGRSSIIHVDYYKQHPFCRRALLGS